MKTDFERELDDIFANLDPHAEAEADLALDIASQFTALRRRRGLSQQELAERLGRTQQAISKIENPPHKGHNLARLKEIVAALDAYLDVTIVPLEDADAYRALSPSKPVLEAIADRVERPPRSPDDRSAMRRTRRPGPVANPRSRPRDPAEFRRPNARRGAAAASLPSLGSTERRGAA